MNTKRLTIGSLAIAITLLLLPAGALGDGDQKESVDYFNGPLGDASFNTPMCDSLLAQACFIVPSGASSVTITVDDGSSLPAAFYIDGEAAGVCDSATRAVSPGDVIHVTANGPVFAALDCGYTSATVGTFTAAFS